MTGVLTRPATAAVAVRLVEPLPGFDDELEFTLSDIDPDGVLVALRSVRDPGLRFVLTPAPVFFDDYRPDVATAVTEVLQAEDADELEVLLVLTIDGDLYGATANLRAPVVLSRTRGTAVQVVLDDDALSMQEPLFRGAA